MSARRGLTVGLVAGLALASAPAAWTHGGIILVLKILHPAVGEIVDSEADGRVRFHFDSLDPVDNATIRFTALSDPLSSDPALDVVDGIKSDCAASDAGTPYFRGVTWDAAGFPSPPDQETLNRTFCDPGPDAGPCVWQAGCYAWDISGVPNGIYFILGSITDANGVGVSTNFNYSRGVVRVSHPGENVPGALVFLKPDGVGDLVDTCYRTRFVANDPDDNATIRLFIKRSYGTNNTPILIADNLHTADLVDGFDIDMAGAQDLVDYQVIAEVDDGHHPVWRVVSPGSVTRYTAHPKDGGCLGTPPPWPEGNTWPPLDAGSPRDASRPPPDASVRADSGVDAGIAPPPSEDAGRKGCLAQETPSHGLPASMWMLLVMVVAARFRRS